MNNEIIFINAWNAIGGGSELSDMIICEVGTIAFWVRTKAVFGENINYKVILETSIDDIEDGFLFATVVYKGISIKEKLQYIYYAKMLRRNKHFNFTLLFVMDILSLKYVKGLYGIK